MPASTHISGSTSLYSPTSSLVIIKEQLRQKLKEEHKGWTICREVRKKKYLYCKGGELHHHCVNWILYNILVGIYRNWMRLAPSLMHLLLGVKKDKREALQRIMDRVIKEN
jgi:hypothetical protein